MLAIIIGVFALLFLYLSYTYYFKPKSQINRYAKLLTSLGYKVHVYPYQFISNGYAQDEKKYLAEHGDAMYKLKYEMKGYDFMIFNIFNQVVLAVINLDVMKEMFTPDKVDIYHKNSFTFKGTAPLLGKGLLFTDGDMWRRKRKIISKFFTHEIMLSNVGTIGDIVDRVLDKTEAQSKNGQNGFSFNVKYAGSQMFSAVILKCFLGVTDVQEKVKGESLATFVVKLLSNIGNAAGSWPVILLGDHAYKYPLTKQLNKNKEDSQLYNRICQDVLAERKKNILATIKDKNKEECSDILEALLVDHLKGGKSEICDQTFTDQELFEELSIFMIAGTDTTSGLLQIMIYFLGENPHVWTKLREIVNQTIKSDADITYENLKNIHYIEWIQHESLRLGGPTLGMLLRKATKDHILKNIPIAKGTGLIINDLPNQCSEQYFKDPYEFRPERWQEQCKNLPAFALFGFSGGPRTCMGKNLALIESKIALVKMVRRYKEIRLPDGKRIMKRTFMYEPLPQEITFVKNT